MANVTLRNVRKTYPGGFEAIKGVDVDVGDGQFCVLVGPSGCGKSTLLRMVAGLETVTGGEIDIGGRIVNQIEPADRDIAMVFQNYALYPHMSVYNNMAYGLRNRGMAEAEIRTRVDEAARILELTSMLERKPRQLSGGQRQRVAMGRAIVRQPKVFLFDEPLSNLDAKLRIRLRDELRRILKQTGMTGLYVTHDQSEAVVLGDRIGVMKDGKLLQMAPPAEIYNRPADSFVANFTGASNILLGKVLARSGDKATIDLGAAGRIEAWTPQPLAVGDKARVALRAENVRLGEKGPANAFSGRVIERRYQGMQTVYDVELGGQRLEALELGTAARHDNGELPLTLPPDQCWAYRDEGVTSVE